MFCQFTCKKCNYSLKRNPFDIIIECAIIMYIKLYFYKNIFLGGQRQFPHRINHCVSAKQMVFIVGINYDSEEYITIWCDTCIIADNHYYPICTEYNELSTNNYNILEDSIKGVYNTVKANCESVYGDYIKNEQKYFKRFKI